MNKFTEADIVTAFDKSTVGTKVVNEATFMWALNQALEKHDPSGDWAPGQHKVVLPESAYESVSAGEGPASDNPRDYHIRLHRGKPSMFLKREKAGKVTSLECIVYTLEAYAADPEVSAVEFTRVRNTGATHVIVAVLAGCGASTALSPYRFVSNLAGGNNGFKRPNTETHRQLKALNHHIDFLEQQARESVESVGQWSVVADRAPARSQR